MKIVFGGKICGVIGVDGGESDGGGNGSGWEGGFRGSVPNTAGQRERQDQKQSKQFFHVK